jgi:hypothetical protein
MNLFRYLEIQIWRRLLYDSHAFQAQRVTLKSQKGLH